MTQSVSTYKHNSVTNIRSEEVLVRREPQTISDHSLQMTGLWQSHYICPRLPSSSPHRSCWWRHLTFITVFFLLLLFAASFLLLCHITVIHVSKCAQSIWVLAVVLCSRCSCFRALSEKLLHLLLYLLNWSFPSSSNPTFQKLLAFLYQSGSLSMFQHDKEQCSTLCILQSSSLRQIHCPCQKPNIYLDKNMCANIQVIQTEHIKCNLHWKLPVRDIWN